MDDIITGEAVPAQFKLYTGILKAGGGDGEPMTLSGVASSTVTDLHGDKIERTALKDMERQVANGLTIFLNHSYRVPEDVAGFASGARITKRGQDGDGNDLWDLDMEITINDENPRAIEAWRGIQKKRAKVGLSIGANIPPDGYEVDRKTGAKTIKRINLLETSIVGIPANPRSWIQMALKSLDAQTINSNVYPSTWTAHPQQGVIGVWQAIPGEELELAVAADDREDDEELEVLEEAEPEITDDTSPDQPDEPSIQDDSEPEASGDPGPEVLESTEEVEPLEGDATVLAAIESITASGEVTPTHLQMAVDIARSLAAEVVTVRAERDAALAQAAEAERVRLEMATNTDVILTGVQEVIKAVGDMPLGRKTVLVEATSKVRHLEGMFSAEFMKMLENKQ